MDTGPRRLEVARFAAGLGSCLLLGWFGFVRQTNVPLLSLVDLGFHELGHLLTYPLPAVVTAMMGSITQVAVPLGLAAYFFLRRDQLGGSLCLAWAATSAQNSSVYIADAPYQSLPLLGNGEHDWAFVLGRFRALDKAHLIAACVKGFGAFLLLAAISVCLWNLVPSSDTPVRAEVAGPPEAPWPVHD